MPQQQGYSDRLFLAEPWHHFPEKISAKPQGEEHEAKHKDACKCGLAYQHIIGLKSLVLKTHF